MRMDTYIIVHQSKILKIAFIRGKDNLHNIHIFLSFHLYILEINR